MKGIECTTPQRSADKFAKKRSADKWQGDKENK